MGFKVIKCPHCGREYLPVEIFYPASFFGKPTTVYRDEQGKIENISGDDMDLSETYICDDCRTLFKVEAKLDFTVTDINNFDEEYTSKLYGDRITLVEPQND